MKVKKLIKKITGIVSSVLVVLIFVICFNLILNKSNNEINFIGDYAIMYVVSGSMEPTIPTKSFIIVERVEADEVEVGDVISFISEDKQIQDSFNTHRVIEIIGDHEEFVTKGDNNANKDNLTTKPENIKARYVKNAAILTAFASWFLTTTGLIVSIIVIVAICCLIYVPDIVKATKNSEKAKNEKLKAEEIERIKAEAIREAEAARLKKEPETSESEKETSGKGPETSEPEKEAETQNQKD